MAVLLLLRGTVCVHLRVIRSFEGRIKHFFVRRALLIRGLKGHFSGLPAYLDGPGWWSLGQRSGRLDLTGAGPSGGDHLAVVPTSLSGL